MATGLTASQGLHWPHPARYRLLRPRHPVQSCHLVDDDTEAQSLVQAHATVEGKRHRSDPGCQSPELGLSAELYPLALLSPATSGPPSPRGEGGEERGPPWSPHLEPAPAAGSKPRPALRLSPALAFPLRRLLHAASNASARPLPTSPPAGVVSRESPPPPPPGPRRHPRRRHVWVLGAATGPRRPDGASG